MKILHLPVNISNQSRILVNSLKERGIEADYLFFYKNRFKYQNKKGILEGKPKFMKKFYILKSFIKVIKNYDIFHFHFSKTFFSSNFDVLLLKCFKKKIIMHFWGDDVRLYSIAQKYNKYLTMFPVDRKGEKKKKKKLKKICKYVDAVIVADAELFNYVKIFSNKIFFLPQVIKVEDYKVVYPDPEKKKIKIVHAPSFRKIKGTEIIVKVINDLKRKYDFEFILLQNTPNRKLLEILTEADIIIDQILLGTYGIFSIESMACGKPVICYINNYYRKMYPKDLPIISANPDNIREILEDLIKDGKKREKIGIKSRKFVENYHNAERVVGKLINIYSGL